MNLEWIEFNEGTEGGEYVDLPDGNRLEVRRTCTAIDDNNHWHRWKIVFKASHSSSPPETFAYHEIEKAKAAAIPFALAKLDEWKAALA